MPVTKIPADPLGDRMKRDYENRTRYYLPRRSYTLLRIDGKSFHNYTHGCERPFDLALMEDMDAAALALCETCDNARLAFTQSDEISVLLTDFGSQHSEAWFDGNLQKITSVAASVATAHFNAARARRGIPGDNPAYFDCRVWTMPTQAEVTNYFLWRQNDATRNSISMTARAYFPHERVQDKGPSELQEMLWREHAVNWDDSPIGFKRGRVVERVAVTGDPTFVDGRTGETRVAPDVMRHRWRVNTEPPVFARVKDWLSSRVPARPDPDEGAG